MTPDGRALVAPQHSRVRVDLLAVRSLPYTDTGIVLRIQERLESALKLIAARSLSLQIS
jgi:hypothetical protein